MAAVFAVAPFAARPVCSVLFGPAEADRMVLPWTLLAIGFYMNSTLNIPYVLTLAMGRPGIALALNGWALVTVLPVTAMLVWRFGLEGAALSWVAYHVLAYWYVVPRIARECLGEEAWRSYLGVAKFMFPAAVIYGAGWVAAEAAAGGSAPGLGAAYVAATALYAVVGWRALSPGARDRIRSVLLGWSVGR
jgi:O-antigen/teichoic acid export membrane protein